MTLVAGFGALKANTPLFEPVTMEVVKENVKVLHPGSITVRHSTGHVRTYSTIPLVMAACPCGGPIDQMWFEETPHSSHCLECSRDPVYAHEWGRFVPANASYRGTLPESPPSAEDARCPNCGHNVERLTGKVYEENENLFVCASCYGAWWWDECHSPDSRIVGTESDSSTESDENVHEQVRAGIVRVGVRSYRVESSGHTCDSIMEAKVDKRLWKLASGEYEREPAPYKIDGGYYWPDFRYGTAVLEVKGFAHPKMRGDAIRKGRQLLKHYPDCRYIVLGTPETECIPCDEWFTWTDRIKAVNRFIELGRDSEA